MSRKTKADRPAGTETIHNAAERLSGLQREILQSIWSHGPSTAEEVRRNLEPSRLLKDSTVRTLLRRLEDKGFLNHQVRGRTYVYQALVRPEKAAVAAVRRIIDRLCGGSVEELLVGMVEDEVLSREQLRDLSRAIDETRPLAGDPAGTANQDQSEGQP